MKRSDNKKGNSAKDERLVPVIDIQGLREGINGTQAEGVELVLVKREKEISVFYGKCLHADALLAGGFLDGDFLTCGSHLWRYNLKNGELDGEPGIFLKKAEAIEKNGRIFINRSDIEEMKAYELDDEDDDDYGNETF